MYTLDELQRIVKSCYRCPLSKSRTNVVFGEGNPRAKLMFVGEGPGFNEDRMGRPFVGRAGQLLDRMIEAIDLKREEVYIANIVKCRPPNNRNPLESESDICIEFLRWQVKIIDPTIIVCLGAVAARNIIDENFKITKERGIWINRGKYHIIATYHPAALLRDENKKKEAWEDFKKIREKYNEV
ncbi:uracil-DNA glycosylase [Tepidimicrobium xylanilyticum]|uniref:Type-4 uracil-DNA glycosylase n=1 Tax=Tepidimicrobium xylanilyticum TaxID=1123352 RepID=A0A1H2XVR5_9FIRM|nr:uracil-DNA glycosylase [Tepidimicrobium xylanilyticum]SDW96698.1 DNA polymerase [Tepidimicrobium xylanilyticum]